jgi:pyruvate kinase
VAKCETRQALFKFKSIVTAADAIIISRGNLGLDVVSQPLLSHIITLSQLHVG